MKIIKITSMALTAALLAACCTGDNSISIAKQGIFASGGSITEPLPGKYDETSNWLSQSREGNTAHVDHANVFYQIPAKQKASPIAYLHGYGQTRTGWQATPDGREGWSDIFLRKGRAAFLIDQPRRGAAGATAVMPGQFPDTFGKNDKRYLPGDQAWYTHFRIGRVAPQRYESSQFPAGDKAQNQFFRQMTPNTGDYDEALFGKSLSSAMADINKMTGRKIVYITHSQGGRVGWKTDAENIAAIIAIEPGFAPEVGSAEYKKFLAAKTPIAIYFGDYIDNGPADIKSTAFWKSVRDQALDFAEHYRKDGGDAEVFDLPKIGIKGNSHFMFQEMNNAEIAGHIEQWLQKRGL